MDIKNARPDGDLVLTLPDPLADGEPERKTANGTKIWNPIFNIAKPLQHPTNQTFINEVVGAIRETQKVCTHHLHLDI